MQDRLRFIYVLALAGAAFNHWRDLILGGWLPYHFAPLWLNTFWTSLALLDPVAIWLLIKRPVYGVWLTLGIMLVDVTVNFLFGVQRGDALSTSIPLLAQVLFLGFVLGSAPKLLRRRV